MDDLRPELKSFGVDYIHSPNIDRLAESGRAFHNHYVSAPTCGASRYTLLTGRYGPKGNRAIFQRAAELQQPDSSIPPSMPEWFRKHGYTTVSVGKVSHHPGGWGGEAWDDQSRLEMPGAWDRQIMPIGDWQHPRGIMHSLAHGEIKAGASFTKYKMDAFQSSPGPDTIYHDGLIADAGEAQLEKLAASDKPFFLAIGLIKPHLPFGAPATYMEPYEDIKLPDIPHPQKPENRTTWHGSSEFFNQYLHYDQDPRNDPNYADAVRRHYAACVSYVDQHVGDFMAKLKSTGRDKDTIVVLWGDHGWHLGEHAIWGKHSLFEESLRSPLIIYYPEISEPGVFTNAIVETPDIFPTLCELTGVEYPDFVHGVSLADHLRDPAELGRPAFSYRGDATTLRTKTHRFILHKDGFAELYDHTSEARETENIADQNPDLVAALNKLLKERVAKVQETWAW